ncbi:hypothetical protein HZH68_005298 [Vespula germanica]|uniref:Uncharacterized protein n=1 Tax=Vespula germanica TaxID=30212 RepID=A0A834KJF2_VESGE|nr:hypothetical protein HZH68_005298 [Vespula germanica]
MDEHGNNMQEVSICDSSMNSSLFVKKAKLSVLQAPGVCSHVRTLARRNGTDGKVIKRLYIQDHFNNNNTTQQQQQQQH